MTDDDEDSNEWVYVRLTSKKSNFDQAFASRYDDYEDLMKRRDILMDASMIIDEMCILRVTNIIIAEVEGIIPWRKDRLRIRKALKLSKLSKTKSKKSDRLLKECSDFIRRVKKANPMYVMVYKIYSDIVDDDTGL